MNRNHYRHLLFAAGAAFAALSAPSHAQPTFPSPNFAFTHPSVDDDVAGAALSNSGKAFMWYKDGTVTAGSAANLDDWRTPYHYAVTPGKTPADIVAMAISSKDKVYTWYKDGTRSVGTSSDLDAYQSPQSYTLPYKPGSRLRYSPEDIVDITISAYDSVTAYYKDGKFSQGTSRNLYAHKSGEEYEVANNRDPSRIIGIAGKKTQWPGVIVWHKDGYYTEGNPLHFGYGKGEPFSQHLTLYTPRAMDPITDTGFFNPNGPGDVHVVRDNMGAVHEPILAPGMTNIALARGWLQIFAKTGELKMSINAGDLWANFLNGSADKVLDLNSHIGLGDCQNDYPQTLGGNGFCVFEAYDTRAAFDAKGGRFVFLANARNYVWQGNYTTLPDLGCSKYIAPTGNYDEDGEEIGDPVYSFDHCDKGHRHLLIAVSKSEDPTDGFHLYAIKENNYRDWPLLAVRGDQLIVGHRGKENKDGYAAIVFDLAGMRDGAKRPRYFKLYKEDLLGSYRLFFPRRQMTGAPLTVGIGNDGRVYGFSRYATGYSKPSIKVSSGSVPVSDGYTLSHGALRVTDNNRFGVNELTYGRYPIDITGSSITVYSQSYMGGYPKSTFGVSTAKYKTFNCARLAIAGNGAEVFGFAGAYKTSATAQQLKYAAAYVRRKGDGYGFSDPAAYRAGSSADPGSSTNQYFTFFNENICDQQGAAEADPANPARVWVMHNYGLEGGELKSALARIDTY